MSSLAPRTDIGGLIDLQVQQVVVTNNATFDGTVYVFKNAGTYYLLGTIRVGERKTFPINEIQSGINNGDDVSDI